MENSMLTNEEIDRAMRETNYSNPKPLLEHPDCIRISYAWLDAQKKTKGSTTKTMALKHIIEK